MNLHNIIKLFSIIFTFSTEMAMSRAGYIIFPAGTFVVFTVRHTFTMASCKFVMRVG